MEPSLAESKGRQRCQEGEQQSRDPVTRWNPLNPGSPPCATDVRSILGCRRDSESHVISRLTELAGEEVAHRVDDRLALASLPKESQHCANGWEVAESCLPDAGEGARCRQDRVVVAVAVVNDANHGEPLMPGEHGKFFAELCERSVRGMSHDDLTGLLGPTTAEEDIPVGEWTAFPVGLGEPRGWWVNLSWLHVYRGHRDHRCGRTTCECRRLNLGCDRGVLGGQG